MPDDESSQDHRTSQHTVHYSSFDQLHPTYFSSILQIHATLQVDDAQKKRAEFGFLKETEHFGYFDLKVTKAGQIAKFAVA